MRNRRYTVRLSDGENRVALEVMSALDCKSVPEMFRWLLDHTQMPDDVESIGDSSLSSRPPLWRYTLRVQERDRAFSFLEKIKNALRTFNR